MTPSPHPATPTLSDLSPEARGLLETQTIELPSWAFGNSGTRFRVFTTAGVPRDPYEKIDDVAQVNAFTGITPSSLPSHPVGQDRRLRRPSPARRGPRHSDRDDQLQRVPGRGLQARQPDQS